MDLLATVKVLLSTWGGLLDSGHSKGGLKELIREGGLFTKSNDKDIPDCCSVLLLHI